MPVDLGVLQIPTPVGTDDNDVPLHLTNIVNRLNIIGRGVAIFDTTGRDALPGAQKWAGRIIWNTTTPRLEVWDGDSWEPVPVGVITSNIPPGTLAARPAAGKAGAQYLATDEHALYLDMGTHWTLVAVLVDDTLRPPDTSNMDQTLTYTSGNLTRVDHRDQAGVLRARTALTYTGADLTSSVQTFFATDGVTVLSTVTEALTYTGADLTSVNRTVT